MPGPEGESSTYFGFDRHEVNEVEMEREREMEMEMEMA